MIRHIGKVTFAVALLALSAQAGPIHISGTLDSEGGAITGGSLRGTRLASDPFEIQVHGGMLDGASGYLDTTFLFDEGPRDVRIEFGSAVAFRIANADTLLFSLWGCPLELEPPAPEPLDELVEDFHDLPLLPLQPPPPGTSLQLAATGFTHAPEPASLFLVLGGGLAAAAVRRRRRAAARA